MEIPKKDVAEFFGLKDWKTPGERIDPYAQSIVDLWTMLEENWSPDGVLDFSLQTIMKRFGDSTIGYPGFKYKQGIAVDKINRNGWYPGYRVDINLTTVGWSFWYKRTKISEDEGIESIAAQKQPFYRKGDSIVVAGQEIDPKTIENK